MPPKAGKGKLKPGEREDAPASPLLTQRPATPNDFMIVATVRTLQNLVNVESKWKNRLLDAQHLSSVTAAKMRRLQAMVEKCYEGIQQLETEVEEIIGSVVYGDANNPLGPSAAHQSGALPTPTPATAAAKSAASGGGNKKAAAEVNPIDQLPPSVLAHRKEQAATLGAVLRAYYHLPRLERERLAAQARPRISSPQLMQAEMEEARRLATPTVELISHAQERALSHSVAVTRSLAAKRQSVKPGKKGEPAVPELPSVDENIIDLNPVDFLPLPCARAVDQRVLSRILTLRSRRIRLEGCIDTFTREMDPLQERNHGVAELVDLGNYSLAAVQPKIQVVVEEEATLQKISQQENEAWLAKRAASAPPATAPAAGTRRQ